MNSKKIIFLFFIFFSNYNVINNSIFQTKSIKNYIFENKKTVIIINFILFITLSYILYTYFHKKSKEEIKREEIKDDEEIKREEIKDDEEIKREEIKNDEEIKREEIKKKINSLIEFSESLPYAVEELAPRKNRFLTTENLKIIQNKFKEKILNIQDKDIQGTCILIQDWCRKSINDILNKLNEFLTSSSNIKELNLNTFFNIIDEMLTILKSLPNKENGKLKNLWHCDLCEDFNKTYNEFFTKIIPKEVILNIINKNDNDNNYKIFLDFLEENIKSINLKTITINNIEIEKNHNIQTYINVFYLIDPAKFSFLINQQEDLFINLFCISNKGVNRKDNIDPFIIAIEAEKTKKQYIIQKINEKYEKNKLKDRFKIENNEIKKCN